MIFVPAVRPPDSQQSQGYWFVFRENRMLVRLEEPEDTQPASQ